jgi:hypothetical protein
LISKPGLYLISRSGRENYYSQTNFFDPVFLRKSMGRVPFTLISRAENRLKAAGFGATQSWLSREFFDQFSQLELRGGPHAGFQTDPNQLAVYSDSAIIITAADVL